MIKLARILFIVTNVAGLFIGCLHMMAHYADLVTPVLASALDFDTPVSGNGANTYKLWQGFSFMMGVSFIVIGLLNLITSKTSPDGIPHPLYPALMMIFSLCVAYSGYAFFAAFQLYGGIALVLLNSFIMYVSLKR